SDPVFEMIEAHRRASQIELRQLLAAASHGAQAPIACTQRAAILTLLKACPTTLDGFAAWIALRRAPNHPGHGSSDRVFVNAIESGDDEVAAAAAGFIQHAALVVRELVSPWVKSGARSSGPPTSSACPNAR